MTRFLIAALVASPASAHMVSMSTSDLKVDGVKAVYELRMPVYELQHTKDAETALFANLRFQGARLMGKSCREEGGTFVCRAEFEFAKAPETLDVECSFHAATVPNHVHVLRAALSDKTGVKTDQAVFDISNTKATIRFRPPTALEIAVSQMGGGAYRAAGGAAQILFLAGLALAARSRRELLQLAAMFAAGQTLAAAIVPMTSWAPNPRFVEAACALTIAYLAVEILFLAEAGQRWLVLAVLGAFQGLYFAVFVNESGYSAGWVMAGALIPEALLIAGFWFVWSNLNRFASALRPVTVSAAALLVTGIVWFFIRLRG